MFARIAKCGAVSSFAAVLAVAGCDAEVEERTDVVVVEAEQEPPADPGPTPAGEPYGEGVLTVFTQYGAFVGVRIVIESYEPGSCDDTWLPYDGSFGWAFVILLPDMGEMHDGAVSFRFDDQTPDALAMAYGLKEGTPAEGGSCSDADVESELEVVGAEADAVIVRLTNACVPEPLSNRVHRLDGVYRLAMCGAVETEDA
jgi:hypothetical protein